MRKILRIPAVCLGTALAAVAAALAADPGGRAPFEGRFEFRSFTREDGLEDLSVECVI